MHAKMEDCNSHCKSNIIRFMQPLIYGFLNHMSIPESVVKQVEGELESVVLVIEDQPHRHWLILLEGGRHFRAGWKDFCDHHHLKVGDFLVFTHQSHFVFQVAVYDPLTACRHIFSSSTGSGPVSEFDSLNTNNMEIENQAEVATEILSDQSQFPTCRVTVTSTSSLGVVKNQGSDLILGWHDGSLLDLVGLRCP